jgi:multidrug efflux pump subunit AcrB
LLDHPGRAALPTFDGGGINPSTGSVASRSINYTLTDADANELQQWSAIFLDKLKSLPEIIDVATDQENAGPLLDITINREVASSYGILPSTIDNTLDDAFGQRIVSTIYTSLNQYHVVLEVDPRFQYGPEALTRIYITSSTGQQVPLSTLVNTVIKAAPIVVNHQGMFPSATISFNLKPGVALGDAVNAIRGVERELGKPQSLAAAFQGNAQAFQSSLSGEPILIAAAPWSSTSFSACSTRTRSIRSRFSPHCRRRASAPCFCFSPSTSI